MIIPICGVHGCGKSSIINAVKLDRPIIKILNLDMSKKVLLNNPGASNQFLRHELYFQTMEQALKLPREYLILVDRAPISLNIYDQSLKDLGVYDDVALTELTKDYKELLRQYYKQVDYSHHSVNQVLMDVPIPILKNNIIERNRGKALKEDNEEYLYLIKNKYDKNKDEFSKILSANTFGTINKNKFYDELLEQLNAFIKEQTTI